MVSLLQKTELLALWVLWLSFFCLFVCVFLIFLGVTEFYLLAVMSYDSYMTISKPLHYTSLMSNRVCHQLVLSSWATGFLMIFPPVILGLKLEFCDSNFIDHFISDSSPILQIPCSDTHFLELMSLFFGCGDTDGHIDASDSLLCVYHQDNSQFPFAQQRTKTFSTCSSHMIVVSISYGSCIFMYIKLPANDRVTLSKGVAVFNTSVAPLMNPFNYTLRNQQVKQAFKDMVQEVWFSSNKWENSKVYEEKQWGKKVALLILV